MVLGLGLRVWCLGMNLRLAVEQRRELRSWGIVREKWTVKRMQGFTGETTATMRVLANDKEGNGRRERGNRQGKTLNSAPVSYMQKKSRNPKPYIPNTLNPKSNSKP